MKINEVEELLQISKANIRFYEKEGLLSPKRAENGYRDYADEDVEQLKKIILFRKMGMAIPDIRGVLSGELSVGEALDRTVKSLEEQLSQLNGSMELARTMIKDGPVNADFDVERYWNIMNEEEAQGSRFMEFVSDYVEFEKRSLTKMWESVFFTPLSEVATEKGWRYGILLILGLCILRGIGKSLVFHTGTFIEGFGYPMLLFAIITLITLSLYIIDYRYRDVPLPEPKNKGMRYGIITGILKLAAFLIVFIIGIIVCGKITELTIEPQYYITDSWLGPVYMIVSFYMLVVLLWMYSDYGVFGDMFNSTQGFRCHLPKKMKKKVLVCSVMVYLVGMLCYSTCYDCFTFDGVSRRILVYNKEYTWSDVDHYTLQKGTDGVLDYVLVMRDGKRFHCLSGDVVSDALPEDRYPDGYEDYCIELTERFVEMGIPLTDTNFEKLYDRLSYDYWKVYLEKLEEIVE